MEQDKKPAKKCVNIDKGVRCPNDAILPGNYCGEHGLNSLGSGKKRGSDLDFTIGFQTAYDPTKNNF